MASHYGETRGMVCGGCGMRYDDFRGMYTWTEARRMIITIGVDNKTGKTKYGRRHGVLGYMHEMKLALWDQHVGECTDAATAAEGRRT